jgi:transposase-like protein
MANKHNLSKEQWWRQTFQRWQQSDQSVRAFCEDEGIGEHAFYWWRRQLRRRDRQPDQQRHQQRQTDHSSDFLPVRVVADPVIEIVLPGQRVLRVPSGFDSQVLRQVLAILEESPPC